MKKFLLGAAALLAMALPAQAWTGCYLGGQGGYSASVTDISLSESYPVKPADPEQEYPDVQTDTLAALSGLGASGPAFGGIVGCDYRLNRFVIGVFGDYLWHNDHDIELSVPGELNASVGLDNQWSIGGRAGFLVNEHTLAYGLAAYTQGETSDLTASDGEESVSFATQDQKGYTIGAGLETHLGNNFYLSGEYRFTQFDKNSYTLESGCEGYCSLDLHTETEVHTGLVSIKYKLGQPPAASMLAPLK